MTTSSQAKSTATEATKTAQAAKAKAQASATRATRATKAEATAGTRQVRSQGRRIAKAAQAEAGAVARTPHRPLLFALGVVDRGVAVAKGAPGVVLSTPARVRTGVVSITKSTADLFVDAQRAYDDVADDGSRLLRSIRRQESTERALHLAERARRRGQQAVRDTEKAVEAGVDAVQDAAAKLG